MESEQTVKGLGSSNLPLSVVVSGIRFAALIAGFTVMPGVRTAVAAAETVKIEGSVSGEDGSRLRNASVTIFDQYGSALVSRTGSDGRFNAIGIAPGIVEILVQRSGFVDDRTRCRLRSGDTARLNARLSSDSIPPGTMHRPEKPPDVCVIEPDTSDRYVIE